jgi:hypothetical protein
MPIACVCAFVQIAAAWSVPDESKVELHLRAPGIVFNVPLNDSLQTKRCIVAHAKRLSQAPDIVWRV